MQANHKLDGLRQCMCLRTQLQVIRAGLEDLNYPSWVTGLTPTFMTTGPCALTQQSNDREGLDFK